MWPHHAEQGQYWTRNSSDTISCLSEHLRCQIDPDKFTFRTDAIDQAAEIQAGATADLYNCIASL